MGVPMPLTPGKSKAAFGKNIKTEVRAGKPVKQAVAIAYSEKARAPTGHEHLGASKHFGGVAAKPKIGTTPQRDGLGKVAVEMGKKLA